MIARMQQIFSAARNHLTRIDQQPLGKAALTIILLLDIFILSSIFDGLAVHTRQLTSPEERISGSCREIVLEGEWNPTNRIERLSGVVESHHSSYYQPEEHKTVRHPLCAPYVDLLDQIKDNKALANTFEKRNTLEREAKSLEGEIAARKGAYDTALLERVAMRQAGQIDVDTIKKDVQARSETLNTLRGKINTLEQTINADQRVRQLWEKIESLNPEQREGLRADLRNMNFWFPVKRLGMELLFLLPLCAVFSLWNAVSIRKERSTQVLVSSHLLVVSFLPILFKIMEFVYDILPKKLFKKIIELLESLKLVAIWHYLVMATAVATALCLIYLFQKKLFSRDKLIERRIAKGQCHQCGKHLPRDSHACVFCGAYQFKTCAGCNNPTHLFGKFCKVCGEAQ